jgi:hypothetical protein
VSTSKSNVTKIKYAIAESVHAPVTTNKCSWRALCSNLSRVNVGPKDGPGWVAAEIPDGPRKSERVLSVSLLVFDIDNKDHTITDIDLQERILSSGYRAVIHSTYNHSLENPRFRLILDISEPISPENHKALLLHVAHNLDINDFIDKACVDSARYFYLPRCPKKSLKDYIFWSSNGKPVDVSAHLDLISISDETLPIPLAKEMPEPTDWKENENNISKVKDFLNYCDANCDYQLWRSLIWAVSSLNWNEGPRILEYWSQESENHWTYDRQHQTENELNQLISSYDPKRGITIGTLIAHAKRNGWAPASPFDPVLIVEPPVTMESHTSNRGYKIYSREDLRRLPKQQWLVHGVLPLQGAAAIFGAPGTGKSFLALDLAVRISEGIDQWFGIGVKQRDVVYMALEGGGGIRKRIDAWEIENSREVKNLQLIIGEFNLNNSEHVSGFLKDMIPILDKGWVTFIDTLNQASPGSDENNSVDMGLLLAAAKRIANESGGVVVLIHHSGKTSSKGLRGHSSMNAAMDLTIEVKKEGLGNSWNTHKVKDGDDGINKHFTLAVHTTSGSTFEEHETSCAIRSVEAPKQDRVPRGSLQKPLFEALKAKYQADGPISVIDVLDLAKEVFVETPNHRVNTRVNETLAALKKGNYIREDENKCIYMPNTPRLTPPTPL